MPTFLPCQCYYCAREIGHPAFHTESTKVNGVIACNRCAHVSAIIKVRYRMPDPVCSDGYSEEQLKVILSIPEWDDFSKWAIGLEVYECEDHGKVFRANDLFDWSSSFTRSA